MKKRLYTVLTLGLVLCWLLGCSGDAAKDAPAQQVKTGETISAASKWIDSSIDGAIDESTPVDLKDDFYTAVNRDWLLSQTSYDPDKGVDAFTSAADILRARKLDIVRGGNDSEAGENPADIPAAQLKHNEELLVKFGALAADWAARDARGVEPIRPYVEAIDGIASMADMTDYLLNKDGTNLSFLFPVKITVGTTFTDHDVNTVILDVTDQFTLDSANSYTNISDVGKLRMQVSNASVRLLLTKLGYPDAKINGILRDCYRFEMRLAKAGQLVSAATDVESYLAETDNRYSYAELEALQGAFPLTEILTHYGYDVAESFSVTYPKYIASVGILYDLRYLDEIKAYYMVHTLQDCMPLVDRATFDRLQEMENAVSESEPKSGTEAPDPYAETGGALSGEDKETAILLDSFIATYLSEPLDQVYIARYCTAEQKTALKDLIARIVAYYSEMLYAEDWLSETAREQAVEKLTSMTVRAVYPDRFTDYSALDLAGCDTLVDAVAAINAFTMTHRVEKINTPKERDEWDMKALPATLANAMYQPSDNSINILAGIMADGFMFNVEDRYEETLAKIGMIVGHEITHGFDTSGYLYDKDGYYRSWWTADDLQAFQLRASKLSNYYSGIIPYPGATGYSGDLVKGEAIADMGGVKCMLGIAEGIEGFDYELFFKTYATMWRTKHGYAIEAALADNEHPLNFLRVNATLQQFEKFYETFSIGPGDGMYLAPDKRVAVW